MPPPRESAAEIALEGERGLVVPDAAVLVPIGEDWEDRRGGVGAGHLIREIAERRAKRSPWPEFKASARDFSRLI